MTSVTLFTDENDKYYGFEASGHAGHGFAGNDIVCAAISVLLINLANSVDELLKKDYSFSEDENKGRMELKVNDYADESVQLLFKSLNLGLKEIAREYPKNLKLTNRRCRP
ncbi:MAG: ribosomal-processing cysteine protease Prp [Lachnospiraceae bacterium]|nr:ribosomal-processing cysteine protease Prp [Lachnospiraceae bacterium]